MMLKNAIMVLEKESSILGYPGEISKALDADHHTVCKYDSPEDPRYIAVRNVLKSLLKNADPRGTKGSRQQRSNKIVAMNFGEYLQVTSSPLDDYNFFRDRWTSNTCHWILDNPAFIDWKNDITNNSRVLWIHGNAASGKSIMSSYIVNHLTQLELPCHYFFLRFSSSKKRSLSTMLRSLACQLAESIPDYAEKIHQLAEANVDLGSSDFRSLWQVLYKQSLFQMELETPCYLVLDGVDEAESPGAIVRLLADLELAVIPLRLVLFSRKTHEISSAFQRVGRKVLVESIRKEGSRDDFRSYIDQELEMAGTDPYKSFITEQLLERSRGNFLWVHLAVQKINTCYTRKAVEDAMNNLPPGMEALYDRMATVVQDRSKSLDGKLGLRILSWATCARRILSVGEMSDALGGEDILEIQRAISDLCGGFVVVDKEGQVAMIHETAREYLTRSKTDNGSLIIDRKRTHDMLFSTCLGRLEDPKLRTLLHSNQPPALLDYAMSYWSVHFSLGNATAPENLARIVKFLKGPQVLTWMYIAAHRKQLKALIIASRYLADVALKLRKQEEDYSLEYQQTIATIGDWTTDLVKIVGKFGNNMIQSPSSIQKLIPPFCPQVSIMYQQFGKKESRALQVSGLTSITWDDCLARFSFEQGVVASSVMPAGSRVAILTNIRKSSRIIVYKASTFEEDRMLLHPERVFKIQSNRLGTLLVSYGYLTTRVWDMRTGECLQIVDNPRKKPRPHSIGVKETNGVVEVVVAGEDRVIRSFSLGDETSSWEEKVEIEEEVPDDAVVNFPYCTALSPDGNMVAFGYRQHPVTVWDLKSQVLLGQCSFSLDASDMTYQDITFGEVMSLTWHPLTSEVFGITQTGLLFKWTYTEDEPSGKVNSGADQLAISRDGSFVATGDAVGTIKIYTTADMSLLYQLTSQDAILDLCFSADSRRIYDVRGSYANVWEPNVLVRLADSSEYPDHASDALSETESLAKFSLQTEHHAARVDNVTTLAGQSVGPLYCYGTENGVVVLGEVGSGSLCELERLTSFMSIEQVAWSEDGGLVAIADLSGKITLKRIIKADEKVNHEFDILIPPSDGHINHLIFHPSGELLFVPTPENVFTINLKTHMLTKSTLDAAVGQLKWICHPTLPDYLLGFGVSNVRVFTWTSLKEIHVYTYSPSQNTASYGENTSSRSNTETLGRIIASAESPHILLSISNLTTSGRSEYRYLVFVVAIIDSGNSSVTELPYTTIPTEISQQINEPLAFLSRNRLLYLDRDRWVCSWRLRTATTKRPDIGKGLDIGPTAVEQYYFLPGDWATANEAGICAVMPDGTLLCPRNGEVATVQSSKLRR